MMQVGRRGFVGYLVAGAAALLGYGVGSSNRKDAAGNTGNAGSNPAPNPQPVDLDVPQVARRTYELRGGKAYRVKADELHSDIFAGGDLVYEGPWRTVSAEKKSIWLIDFPADKVYGIYPGRSWWQKLVDRFRRRA